MKKKMRRGLSFMVFAFFVFSIITPVSAFDCEFTCSLQGNKVGPKPADTQAKGSVIFQFDEEKQEIFYKLQVEKIEDVYMAHLHIGPPSKQGPIAVWLYPAIDKVSPKRIIKEEYNGTLAQGTIKQKDIKEGITFEELIKHMKDNQTYVNVHTRKYIPGEIRGQVINSYEKIESRS